MKRLLFACALVACKSSEPAIQSDDAADIARRPASLVGRWKADGSGREMEAREENGVVRFHVVDPDQWHTAYVKDEVRFSIRWSEGRFLVTDRYRPFDLGPGVHYEGEEGRAACLRELTVDQANQPLRAEWVDSSTLTIDFAHVEQDVKPANVTNEVVSCGEPRVTGVLRRTIRRVKSP